MYLDPGIGSMIIQVLVAAIAAIGGAWFILKKEIKGWINKRRGIVEEDPDKDVSAEPPQSEAKD